MNAEFEPAGNTDKIDDSFPHVLVSSLSGTLVSLAADRRPEPRGLALLGYAKEFIMTRPHAIVGRALATAVINVVVALVLIVALTPEAARIEPQKLYDSTPLYRLSPIPAGADWGR